MLEENNDIDNLFKSVIEPYKMDPPEKVWSSLNAGLTAKQSSFTAKKGYYGFRFLSITAAAVVLSFVAYQILAPTSYFNTSKAQEKNLASPIAGYSANDNTAKNETANATTSNDAKASQNGVNDNVINANSQADYVESNSSNAVQASQSENLAGAGSSQDDAGNFYSSTGSSNNATSSNSTSKAIPSSSQTAGSQATASISPSGNESEEPKTAKADESTNSVSDSAANLNANSAEDDAANLSLLSLKESKRHFSIDAFYSPDIIEGNFATNNTNATQSAATTNTGKFNLSFNAGAMLRYDINDRWSISIGCSYSTLNYSTSLTTSYVVTTSDSGNGGGNHGWGFPKGPTDTTLSQHFNDPNFFNNYFPYSPSTNTFNYNNNPGSIQLHGNPVLSPPSSSNQPGEVVYFTTNANMILQYINIPLTIGYKISCKRLDYYVSGGVSIDFLVNQQATVNIADVYSETTNDITGLNKTSYSYLFGAGARYHLYKGVSVFIEPAFRGALTSITTAPANSFYPYYFGVNTGVSVHF